MISDREATEQEYATLRLENPRMQFNQPYIWKLIEKITDSTLFQYNTAEMERLVNEQNYRKIKARNFNGLNMTSIKMTIQGELALAESELSELKQDDFPTFEDYSKCQDELRERLASN